MDLRPWQQVVVDYLNSPTKPPSSLTDYAKNMEFGLFIKMPRHSGHTTLAQEIIRRYPTAVVCVPSDLMPRACLQRYKANLGEDLISRVFVSTPQEASGKRQIIAKEVAPLAGATILIVDDASQLSEWELNTLRCAQWDKYVELN